MEHTTTNDEILQKRKILAGISQQLKQHFIGLNNVIDEVMNLVSAWYLFPESQLRPTVINLWGMTGSGKTALIQKLVELLDHKRFYVQMDMGEFESDSASWIKSTFTDDLEFFHQQNSIICLDEFQFAKTLDGERELGKDKLRVVWDLLDSGKISYIPGGNTYYLRRAEQCLNNLMKAAEKGVEIENGVVMKSEEQFLKIFNGYFFEDSGRSGKALDKDYFVSYDFLQGLYQLYEDDNATREILDEKVKRSDLQELIRLLINGMHTRNGVKVLDLSKSLIFVLGNLDEAYYMSSSLNPDINADELHEATSRINITHIKKALKKRFRNEQIARLGNNHIIYRSFTNGHFEELIRRELFRVNRFVNEKFNFSLVYDPSLSEIIYREGVFPAQGTRPVFTTVKNLVEAWISKIVCEVLERNMPVAIVEWSYTDDKYVFVFKDASNNILNIYEEKVNLKTESLRKTTNRNIQAHVAVHEAGHAVLAALTLRILPSVVVSKTAADNCEGFCLVNFPEGMMTRDTLKKDIVILLGGYVAEKMIFGEDHTSSGVYSDLESASSLANKAIKYYGMGKDPVHVAVHTNSNNEYFFNKEVHAEQAMLLVKESQKEAEKILLENKLALLKIAEYLTGNSRMEEKQIGEYLKLYSVEEWVSTTGFIKKEDYFAFDDMVQEQLKALKENSIIQKQ